MKKLSLVAVFCLCLSFFVHALVLYYLSHPSQEVILPKSAKPAAPIIHAIAVDKALVQIEVMRLESEERAQQQKRIAEQLAAKRAVSQAKIKRAKEEAKIAQLKKAKLAMVRKQLQAQKQESAKIAALRKKVNALKQASSEKQKRLKALEQKQANLKKSIDAKKQAAHKMKEEILLQEKLAKEQDVASAPIKALQSEINKYTQMVKQKVTQHLIWQGEKHLSCLLKVHLAPDGSVVGVTVEKVGQNIAYCQAAERAIYKASPLPVPENPRTFSAFRHFLLTVKASEFIS